MSKVTLASVGNILDATTAAATIDSNNAAIVAAIDNTLSRDGTIPNPMNASLDMNSNRIINLPSPQGSLDAVRLVDLATLNGGGTINTLPTGGTTSQVLAKNSSTNYDVSWQSVAGGAATSFLFGGRLTPTSGQPVLSADASGSQTIFYAPYIGKTLPTYTGGVWTTRNFTASSTDQVGLSLSLGGSANWLADSIHDVFAVMDSGTLKIATRLWDAAMLQAETLITPATTITTGTTPAGWSGPTSAFDGNTSKTSAGSIALVTPSNNSEANYLGQNWGGGNTNVISKVIVYTCTDASLLGVGVTAQRFTVYGSSDGSNWHLITVWYANDTVTTGNTFTIPISQTETQAYQYHRVGFDGNGSNAIRVAQVQFYKRNAPTGGRRLTHNDGVLVNDAVMTARTSSSTTISVAQYEGIYLGTIHIDNSANGQVSAHVTFGPSRAYGVWNYYNRVPLKLIAGTYSTTKSYTPVTTQLWNACESAISGTTFSAQVLCGCAEEPVSSDLNRSVALNCTSNNASYECGIGIDTTLNFSGAEGSCNQDSTGQAIGWIPRAWLKVSPFAGVKTLYALERQGNSGTGGQTSYTGPRNTMLTSEWRG